MVATLAGGVEIDPPRSQGTVAGLKAKAIGTMRLAAQRAPSVRRMLRLAVRARETLSKRSWRSVYGR